MLNEFLIFISYNVFTVYSIFFFKKTQQTGSTNAVDIFRCNCPTLREVKIYLQWALSDLEDIDCPRCP